MSEALPGILQIKNDQDLFTGALENGCLKMSGGLPGILQIKNGQDLFIVSLENGWLKMSKVLPGALPIKIFRRFTGEWLSEDV